MVSKKDAVPRLYSSAAGYYSHMEGARYINPLISGAKFPLLVELHESQHEYLALANVTDGIARLYAGVLVWGGDKLRDDHRQEVDKLFHAIHEHTVYTHEVLATYISFVLFASKHPEDVTAARAEIEESYEEILREGEQAFGKIGDPRFDTSMLPAIMACAMAAMNPPFPQEIVRFDRLAECRQFIAYHSPDRRFRSFMEQFVPAWEQNSLFSGLHGLSPEDVQAHVYSRLRSRFPDIEFVTFDERPTYFRDSASVLIEDGRKYSYGFLEGRAVAPHPDDTASRRFGARLVIPGRKEWEPLDLSLWSTNYASGSLEELIAVADACSEQDAVLFCHLLLHDEDVRLLCFALNSLEKHVALPIKIDCTLSDLISTLRDLPRGSLVLKIDERFGPSVPTRLAHIPHPVFMLAHDTRPQNLVSLVQQAIREQEVSISRFWLDHDGYRILWIYLHRDRFVIAAPIGELGLEILTKEVHENEKVTLLGTEAVVSEMLGMDEAQLSIAMRTCFVKGPPMFNLRVSSTDLLQGVYAQTKSKRKWWQFWSKT